MEKIDNVTACGHRRASWDLQPGELLLCSTHPWGYVRDEWVQRVTIEEDDNALVTFETSEGLIMQQYFSLGLVFVCKESES